MLKEVAHNREQMSAIAGRLLALEYGKPILVTYGPYKPPKTTPQIRYAHGIMKFIAKAKRCTLEDVKTDCKREFGIITVGTSSITGERSARLVSLADYNKEQIEVFITQLEHYCDSNNIKYIEAE
jgi:hypothetical protein